MKIGVDIVSVNRIKKVYDSHDFAGRIFTETEKKHVKKQTGKDVQTGKEIVPYNTISGIFCAKEAVSKALGYGIARGVSFKNIEVDHNNLGAPIINLNGEALKIFKEAGLKEIAVSVTHDNGVAIAVCVMN